MICNDCLWERDSNTFQSEFSAFRVLLTEFYFHTPIFLLKGKVRKIENIGYMFEIRNYFAIIIDVETEIVQVLRKFS